MARRSTAVYQVPKVVNERGNIPITRKYDGVGKIRVSSGTKDANTYVKILKALDEVFDAGNLATLESVKNRVIKPLELLESVRQNGVNKVITVDNSQLLVPAVKRWLETYDIKESTRRGYRSHLAGFLKACKATDTLKDLTPRMEQYRKVCQRKGIAVSFNQCRTALLAFTRDQFKRKSNLYLDLRDVDTLPVQKKVHNEAVSVNEVRKFTKKMKSVHSDLVWSMCFTGLRPGEYLEEDEDTTWSIASNHVAVRKTNTGHGNKGESRKTILPFPVVKPARGQKSMRVAFKAAREATGMTLTPHSCRKCFIHWCLEAGIPETRVREYVGHEPDSVTGGYARHDVTKYLDEDAEKFRAYVKRSYDPQLKVNPNAKKFFVDTDD